MIIQAVKALTFVFKRVSALSGLQKKAVQFYISTVK
jgi:hypothetical protein